MLHRTLTQIPMAEAVEVAEDLGLDVTHRYERIPAVNGRGELMPELPPAIARLSTISWNGTVLKAEAESGGWGSPEEFDEFHGNAVQSADRLIAEHQERKVKAIELRDAVAAAPTRETR
jgi:hypothetical protein